MHSTAAFSIRPVAGAGLINTFPQFRNTDLSPSGGAVGAADIARHLPRPQVSGKLSQNDVPNDNAVCSRSAG